MVKLWKRYKLFISAGMQELITYRVNFFFTELGMLWEHLLLFTYGEPFSVRRINP
ncbi:daunorubicin resistance transmembrane protein [Streptococcus pneumoniae GA19101]|nr:daunorubicin resistance transmembrane protein [Streptococcus pneumoniae GA19101]EHZ66136.1 daunorubicin resistance transmembrane protein [Streptococcus pneumoniae GA47597]